MADPHTTGAPFVPPGHYRPPGRDAPLFPAMGKSARVQRMLEQIAGEVAGLEPAVMRKLLPVFMEARSELRSALTEWLKGKDGAARFTAQQYRRALVNLEGALRTMAKLDPAMRAALEDGGNVAGHLAAEHLEFELARFASAFGETIRPIQIQTAAIMAKGDRFLIPRYRTSAARYAGNVMEDIGHQLSVGVARGETYTQMTNRLRRLGGPRGLVALRGVRGEPGAVVEEITEGLFRRYRNWGERVVRTEMQNAYNVHADNGIDELNQIAREPKEARFLKRWDASADKRLCHVCRGLDRQAVPQDGKFHSELGEHDRPPAHPNCRCIISPWLKRWGNVKRPEEPTPIYPGKEGKAAKPKRPKAKPKRAKAPAKPKRKELTGAQKVRELEKLSDQRDTLAARVRDPGGTEDIRREIKGVAAAAKKGKIPFDTYLERLRGLNAKLDAAIKVQPEPADLFKLDAIKEDISALRATVRPQEWLDALVDAGTAGKQGKWKRARLALEGHLEASEGITRQAHEWDHSVALAKNHRSLGTHYWNGKIKIRTAQAEHGKKYLDAWKADPKAVEAVARDYEAKRLAIPRLERDRDRFLARMDKVEAKITDMSADMERAREAKDWDKVAKLRKRRNLLRDGWEEMDQKLQATFREIDSTRGALRKHAGAELARDVEGLSTVVHEVVHGTGPNFRYSGIGVALEEVTTEATARLYLQRNFALQRGLATRGVSYDWFFEEQIKAIREAYGVTERVAWDMLESASLKFKRVASSSTMMSAEDAADLFVRQFKDGAKHKEALIQGLREGMKRQPSYLAQ